MRALVTICGWTAIRDMCSWVDSDEVDGP